MAGGHGRLVEVVAAAGLVALGLVMARRCAAPPRAHEHWLHRQLVGPV